MDYYGMIAILLWVGTIIFYVIRNLYIKNLKLENRVVQLQQYAEGMSLLSAEFSKLVDTIDDKIWVQSDPEFISLIAKAKEISETLKTYGRVNE